MTIVVENLKTEKKYYPKVLDPYLHKNLKCMGSYNDLNMRLSSHDFLECILIQAFKTLRKISSL